MRRISIVFVWLAFVATAAESRLSAQSGNSSANLTVSATVTKNCTITTAPVAFGNYDSVATNATAPLDGVGTITVKCTKGAAAKVGLSAGSNAQGATRRMAQNATDHLTYELYKDTGRATIWGNTATTGLDVPAAPSQVARPFTVYGRVAQAQEATVGSYADTVVATVNF
jgi:spore coat protein U-like protein